MTTTQTPPTHLAAAEAALRIADEEVVKVENEIAPVMEKFAALYEQLGDLTQTQGTGAPAVRKVLAAIAALDGQVRAGRHRLEVAQRRRAGVVERVASERRAIADLEQRIAAQEQREARQAAAIESTEAQLREKYRALDVERRELRRLRDELATLTGEQDGAHQGDP